MDSIKNRELCDIYKSINSKLKVKEAEELFTHLIVLFRSSSCALDRSILMDSRLLSVSLQLIIIIVIIVIIVRFNFNKISY